NTITGGAALDASSGLRVRGRCRTQTLSFASIAILEGSLCFHWAGTFGHERSTSNVGRLRDCACAAPAIINTCRTTQRKSGFFMDEPPLKTHFGSLGKNHRPVDGQGPAFFHKLVISERPYWNTSSGLYKAFSLLFVQCGGDYVSELRTTVKKLIARSVIRISACSSNHRSAVSVMFEAG